MSFKDIWKYTKIYKKYLGRKLYLVLVLTIAGALAEGLGIALLLPLLKTTDTTADGTSSSFIERSLNQLLEVFGIANSMTGILIFIGIVFILKGLLKFAESGYKGILQAKLLRNLKSDLFEYYSHIDYHYYLKKNTGHFINVVTQQVNDFFQSFNNYVGFISNTVMTVVYLAVAFAMSWKFAAMAFLVGIVMMNAFKILNRYVRDLSIQISSERSELNKLLVQGLQALKYVMSTGQANKMQDSVNDSIKRMTYDIRWQNIARAFTNSLKEPISILFIVGIIAFQIGVMNEPLAPIFVAIILFNRGMQSMMTIQTALQSMINKIGAVEMVDREYDLVRRNQETNGSLKIDKLTTGIEYSNVTFSYGKDEKTALKNISLSIPAKSTIALVGESGAGKSTLVDTLNLLLKPQNGSIHIDGTDARELDVASWRRQIGYVSQETVVFDDTVANNICMWEQGDLDNENDLLNDIKKAARKAYAHQFIMELPDGYQTQVGDRGVRLSGGQRQRLFIARELFKKPNLLILDEATSALDTESERYIQESIDALRGEITVVIIAHRLSTIKNADKVFVLEEGELVEEGTYNELNWDDQSRFRKMVEMQSL